MDVMFSPIFVQNWGFPPKITHVIGLANHKRAGHKITTRIYGISSWYMMMYETRKYRVWNIKELYNKSN